jgi:aspartyl-tRNA synthetase
MVAATVPLVGETVLLKGWVQTRRDMGKIAFVDLRDRSGMVQVVLVPSEIGEAGKELMKELRTEYCISVTGVVQARSEKQINTEIETGTVEILAKELEILNPSKTPPFELDETSGVNEEVRLKYRYLD